MDLYAFGMICLESNCNYKKPYNINKLDFNNLINQNLIERLKAFNLLVQTSLPFLDSLIDILNKEYE